MTSALERARVLLQREVFPGDVVAGIIAASGLEELPSSELFLSTVFYEFSLKKPQLFSEFDFFPDGTYPYTDVLSELLHYLEAEHFLGKPNPSYARLQVAQGDAVDGWVNRSIFAKLEARGWLDDVKELGVQLKQKVEQHAFERDQRGEEEGAAEGE